MAYLARCGDSLEPLLDRLLGVEPMMLSPISRLPANSRTAVASSSAFLRRIRDVSERSGSGENTAFPKSPMQEAAGHAPPFLGLALAVDHEVNRYVKPTKLSPESPILLPAALKVWLDNEQVQVAIGSRLAPGPQAEQNDVRLRSSCG
jgi:hypothetical protein